MQQEIERLKKEDKVNSLPIRMVSLQEIYIAKVNKLIRKIKMTKYQELEQKVAEMQQEIERLKKEEKLNSLPNRFVLSHAINLLKAYDEKDTEKFKDYLSVAFDWRSTSQRTAYWVDRQNYMTLFTVHDYVQVQKWIILSYQQEME